MDKKINQLNKISKIQGNELIPISTSNGGGVFEIKSTSPEELTGYSFDKLFWIGTQEEYDNLSSKKTNTFYYITE